MLFSHPSHQGIVLDDCKMGLSQSHPPKSNVVSIHLATILFPLELPFRRISPFETNRNHGIQGTLWYVPQKRQRKAKGWLSKCLGTSPTEEVFGQGPSTSMPMFMGNMRCSLLNTFHSIWGWVKTPIPL